MRTWRDPLRKALLLCAFVFLSCAPRAGLSSDWKKITPPIPAPEFTLSQLDGSPISLSDLRGQIVAIEFWATWCGPCRFSLPSLDAIYKRYQERGVRVLLVNQGEQTDVVRRWAQKRFSSPILLDKEQSIAQLYMVSGIPQLFVIDKLGQIAYVHSGYQGGLERSLSLILDGMLEADNGISDGG